MNHSFSANRKTMVPASSLWEQTCASFCSALCSSPAHTADPRPQLLPGSGRMAAQRVLWVGLLGALMALQTQAQSPNLGRQASVQPSFQQDKFLGRWFGVGLASNSTWFREKKAVLSVCKFVAAPNADGGLNLTSTFLRNNQCETRSLLLQPSGTPGRYSYTSPHRGTVHDVVVVETDYSRFALLLTVHTKGPDHDLLASLYSRTQDPSAEVREKFSRFAKAQGLTEDTIVFPPRADKCMEESK
ncbi:prostaglandin-H2 D-isomerase isoform X2 [Choloepus didactylus]|uniref:prostaglandin-H2 D-isomerase isoform X2 n=1 Tax=Choloepus didactylus TaxID=27675 RepID=UPI0018A0A6A4|nr:prostaglandin-H2 D-isomerase isoform X2 [Choloepus didactylus]